MSGRLGYDPDLVDALQRAMRRALDELDLVHCADVEATAAMQQVLRCRSLLADTWLPFVDGLLRCRAMDGYQPVRIDAGDLLGTWLAAAIPAGWRILSDPLFVSGLAVSGAPAAITPDQARALGEALSGATDGESLDADEIAWLASTLGGIAADADLRAAFLPALTTAGWTALCNQLARNRQLQMTAALLYDGRASAAERTGWADIDAVFAALGAALVSNHEVHPFSDATLLVEDDMTPLAAALLVQHLDLDADTLAALTRQLVQRERVLIDTTAETQLGPRAADLLLATIARTPRAATAYVLLTIDDPDLLLESSFDPQLGVQVATLGTDPTNMTADQAEHTVPQLVRWFLDASRTANSLVYNPALASGAAEVIAPYLLPLLRSTDDGWGVPARERRAVQQLVIGDSRAFDRLLAKRDQIAATLGTPLSGGDAEARIAAVRDIADVLAFIDTMQRAQVIGQAQDAQAEWELMWALVGSGQNALPINGMITGAATAMVRDVVERAGWAPGSVDQARTHSLDHFDAITTVACATLVAATFDEMVEAGRIPSDAPPPPAPDPAAEGIGAAYSEAFVDWLEGAGLSAAAVYELTAIKEAIASDHETTANANEGVLGT